MAEQHEKALVPQIRFAGFTDPWEQRKLEDYVVVSTAKNVDGRFNKEDVLSVQLYMRFIARRIMFIPISFKCILNSTSE